MGLISIDKDRLVSPKASRIFLAAAITSAVWVGFFFIADLAGFRVGQTATDLITVPGAIGSGLIYFGMWLYWIRADRSARPTKIIWAVAFLFPLWLASIAYYFLVYRQQTKQEPQPKAST